MSNSKNEAVVLLHGLGLCALYMKKIEFNLESEGYHVFNIDYASRKNDIDSLTTAINKRLSTIDLTSYDKVHFLGHSLGSILIRNLLSKISLRNEGSVIALAPPNRGSLLADRLKTINLFCWYFGPAAAELSTDSDFLTKLTHVPSDYHVIAGSKSNGTLFGRWFNELSDGTVSVESTKVVGMNNQNHAIYPTTHLGILFDDSVVKKVIGILN